MKHGLTMATMVAAFMATQVAAESQEPSIGEILDALPNSEGINIWYGGLGDIGSQDIRGKTPEELTEYEFQVLPTFKTSEVGQTSDTVGLPERIESIEIILHPKDDPDNGYGGYKSPDDTCHQLGAQVVYKDWEGALRNVTEHAEAIGKDPNVTWDMPVDYHTHDICGLFS